VPSPWQAGHAPGSDEGGTARTDVVKGVSAGAVGVWAMDVLTWAMYQRDDPSIVEQEKQVRASDKDTAHALAQRLARLAGSDAADTEPNAGGIAIHALLGMVPGAVYARTRPRLGQAPREGRKRRSSIALVPSRAVGDTPARRGLAPADEGLPNDIYRCPSGVRELRDARVAPPAVPPHWRKAQQGEDSVGSRMYADVCGLDDPEGHLL
jgi:hypothetical protein